MIVDDIKKYADKYDLDRSIVYGVCMTESALKPNAYRFEPKYRWFFQPEKVCPKGISFDTERNCQATSWGIMQVMGAVYRAYGYTGDLPAIINDVDTQLDYGCKHLARFKKRFPSGNDWIAAYNAGSPRKENGRYVNQKYVDTVFSNAGKFDFDEAA